jgi:hypothetical protein
MTLKNTLTLLLFFFLWSADARAQDTCVYLFSIPESAHFVAGDHLANTYLLHGFEVEKYDSTGRFVSRYSNNRLGMPAFLDASNPMKILVWYADFQTAVFLDRNLTELGRLSLAEAGYPAVRCLASSADGNLWAYDESTAHMIKLSTAGEKLMESQPLNLEFSQRIAPTCIRDDGGQGVYLSDPLQGVAIFDPFAQLDKTLLLKGLTRFEVENGTLFFTDQASIRTENWRGFNSKTIPLPATAKSANAVFWFSKKRLFVLTDSGIAVYSF